jgi:hypothetical protein
MTPKKVDIFAKIDEESGVTGRLNVGRVVRGGMSPG